MVRQRVKETTGFRKPRALGLWHSERSEDATTCTGPEAV